MMIWSYWCFDCFLGMCLELDTRWTLHPYNILYIYIYIFVIQCNSMYIFIESDMCSLHVGDPTIYKYITAGNNPTKTIPEKSRNKKSPGPDVDTSCNQSAMICEGITSIQVTDANKILEIFAATFREPWQRRVVRWKWHGFFQRMMMMMMMMSVFLFSRKEMVFFYKKGMNLKDFLKWDQRNDEGNFKYDFRQFHGYRMIQA